MDPAHEGARKINTFAFPIPLAPVDLRSVGIALLTGFGFFVLGIVCLALSRFDAVLASVWLPNAMTVAVLLLARPRSEVPLYACIALASLGAQAHAGFAPLQSLFLTAANLIDIALITRLTRKGCGERPAMTDLGHLGCFLLYGGVIGPVVSATVAAFGMAGSVPDAIAGAAAWFLADSMGMILIVPAVLLIAEAVRVRDSSNAAETLEHGALMLGGMIAVMIVFSQSAYPLMFVIPPITLLVAFRLGGLGTALYVPGTAILASWMTFSGYGPIAGNAGTDIGKMFVMQAFIAANFLTGLPIAAILAGRDRMTAELVRGRRELSLLAENVTDAVLRINRRGICTYASPSVREVLAREPGDLIDRPLFETAHDDAGLRFAEVVDRLLRGDIDKERISYRRDCDAGDGRPVYIEADCAIAIDSETGMRSGVVISARDISARVELEQLLTRARRKAEDAASAKSEFLANMSHEIRTPMNGVLGFADLLLQGDLTDQERRHAQMIAQSGRSMMMLLNDILDLSKIEAGQVAIDKGPVDLFATIADCTALHAPAAAQKGLSLSFHKAQKEGSEKHRWIVTDGLRLRQIMLNLIGNAVKFTPSGSVDIRCRLVDGEVLIEIADTGIGIDAASVDAIFSPFTQGESDTARRFGGTGLGLSISRQLAELLGGRIAVESAPGRGSVFTVALPASLAEPDTLEPSTQPPAPATAMPDAARVLLVEDNEVNRVLGMEMLERCGQTVEVAHDGHEAIAMVLDGMMRGKPFDLVLMDVQMPVCDGYAATRAIRAEGIGAGVLPIIALTANAFPEDIADAREAGMQGHLAKPLAFADLARVLQRWLPTRIVDAGVAVSEAAPTAQHHTPKLQRQWEDRRQETIRAVRRALDSGALERECPVTDTGEELARLVHRLAGTAAVFGEAELGDQAAALERAIRQNMSAHLRKTLARDLLDLADDRAPLMGVAGH